MKKTHIYIINFMYINRYMKNLEIFMQIDITPGKNKLSFKILKVLKKR